MPSGLLRMLTRSSLAFLNPAQRAIDMVLSSVAQRTQAYVERGQLWEGSKRHTDSTDGNQRGGAFQDQETMGWQRYQPPFLSSGAISCRRFVNRAPLPRPPSARELGRHRSVNRQSEPSTFHLRHRLKTTDAAGTWSIRPLKFEI